MTIRQKFKNYKVLVIYLCINYVFNQHKLIICLLNVYVYIFSPFNSNFFNVSNYILLYNYIMFMKKIFS